MTSVLLSAVYRPDEWRDFFVMVGGAAAVLTGLVFVAMSLNVTVIANDATHRYRALGTLTGITAVFVVCAFALMGGQDHRAVGIEWFVVTAVAAVAMIVLLGFMISGAWLLILGVSMQPTDQE